MRNIFQWIRQNKDWLFSGIGVSILFAIIRFIPGLMPGDIFFPKTYYFGYIPDSWPVSFKKGTSLRGYCYDIMKKLNKDNIKFKEAIIPYEHRFSRSGHDYSGRKVSKKRLLIECGPNTINKERKDKIEKNGGKFSEPFYTTGLQLLFKDGDHVQTFMEDTRPFLTKRQLPLKDKKIAILGNPTNRIVGNVTSTLVGKVYSQVNVEFYPNRGEIINALVSSNAIIAYASDEVLLKGFYHEHANQLTETGASYIPCLLPSQPLSYEEYGIVVYDVNGGPNKYNELLKKINGYIKKKPLSTWLEEYPNWDDEWEKLSQEKHPACTLD